MRGLAALWVLVGHAMILSGWGVPIVAKPAFAVDLFILISGFLMTFHYQERRAQEPWGDPSTWRRFWTRRFFRIAPLYYVALAAAILAGPTLGEMRQAIAVLVPVSATPLERYADQSIGNIAMHASFLFGLSPNYGFRTALPDWSIGLEMQYYLAFPLLMLLIARFGHRIAGPLLALACLAAGYLFRDTMLEFPEPSLLVLKLPIFLAGMAIAGALERDARSVWRQVALALVLVALPVGRFDGIGATLCRLIIAAGFAALVLQEELPGLFGGRSILARIDRLLGGRLCHQLGELSYGIYLIHLLVLIPALGFLATRYGSSLSPLLRFAIAAPVTIAITCPAAWLAHVFIERPGIRLGRRLLNRQTSKGSTTVISPPEGSSA